jgi:hypothetical protein
MARREVSRGSVRAALPRLPQESKGAPAGADAAREAIAGLIAALLRERTVAGC